MPAGGQLFAEAGGPVSWSRVQAEEPGGFWQLLAGEDVAVVGGELGALVAGAGAAAELATPREGQPQMANLDLRPLVRHNHQPANTDTTVTTTT